MLAFQSGHYPSGPLRWLLVSLARPTFGLRVRGWETTSGCAESLVAQGDAPRMVACGAGLSLCLWITRWRECALRHHQTATGCTACGKTRGPHGHRCDSAADLITSDFVDKPTVL